VTSPQITSILGFDYGAKRIGVATGQTITRTATPITTINAVHGSPDWAGIQKLIDQWKPDALIVGIPYFLDGKESEMTKTVQNFCDELEKRFTKPILKVNETLSSYEAEETLKKNMKIGKHNKQEIDKMAAAVIVQSWLDQQN
jgi:putative Holliday junction resolvase